MQPTQGSKWEHTPPPPPPERKKSEFLALVKSGGGIFGTDWLLHQCFQQTTDDFTTDLHSNWGDIECVSLTIKKTTCFVIILSEVCTQGEGGARVSTVGVPWKVFPE